MKKQNARRITYIIEKKIYIGDIHGLFVTMQQNRVQELKKKEHRKKNNSTAINYVYWQKLIIIKKIYL